MEMWWIGKSLSLTYLSLIFVMGFIANFALDFIAGFRDEHSVRMAFDEAVDSMAVGIALGAVLLLGMNQLRHTDGPEQGVGMVILLSLPLSVGASVAREVFNGRTSRMDDDQDPDTLTMWQGLIADFGATIIGGVFVGLSIAPTDEIEMIAAGLRWWHLYILMGLSLLLSYIIVFASGFDEASPPGVFQHPLSETMLSYVISLAVALLLLVVFERVSLEDPFYEILRQTVVLAVPVAIGGAGGRLVI
jgi:putative integral membrane protein (TIGR02587 family)